MGEVASTNGTSALKLAEGDPVALRAQIETTRAELGDTVAALAIKADVKQQARDRVALLKQQAAERAALVKQQASERAARAQESARTNPLPFAAAGAALLGLVALRIARR